MFWECQNFLDMVQKVKFSIEKFFSDQSKFLFVLSKIKLELNWEFRRLGHKPLFLLLDLDLVTLLISSKTVTKLHNVTKSNDFMQ